MRSATSTSSAPSLSPASSSTSARIGLGILSSAPSRCCALPASRGGSGSGSGSRWPSASELESSVEERRGGGEGERLFGEGPFVDVRSSGILWCPGAMNARMSQPTISERQRQ